MKATVKVSPMMMFEIEGQDQKSIWEQISSLQEVFGNQECKRCSSPVIYVTREVDGNSYYELRCTNSKCRAKLSFGVHRTGGSLFPKRTNEDGKYHKYSGWKIYNKDTGKEE